MLYPLRLRPLYYEKVWGGRRLATVLGRELPPDQPVGESWEVADHPHGESVVANGPEQGRTLHEMIVQYGDTLLGSRVFERYGDRFPLLIKYLDPEDKLSVQVHPDDAYGFAHEGEPGKTEMWYVLYAEPEAFLIAGLREGVTREDFREALQGGGDPASLMHRMPVKAGDAVFIPAGRIHALLPGVIILEIQQNSDTTYRLYDWDRLGLDGQPRALHVEQALAVTNWTDYTPAPQAEHAEEEGANRRTLLAACDFFVVEKYDLAAERVFKGDTGSLRVVNCVAGSGQLAWAQGTEPLAFGDTLLIPAALTEFSLQPAGEMAVVVTSVP